MADITAFMEGRNNELPGSAMKVLKAMRMEVEEEGLELSITAGGKEGTSEDMRTRKKQLEAKEKAETVRLEVLICQKESRLSGEL